MAFKTLEHGYDGQMVGKKAEEYIQPMNDQQAYRDVRDMVVNEAEEIIKSTNDSDLIINIEQIIAYDEIQNMMEGTTNLINTIIEKEKAGTPVKTMVFLDKSARTGAYIFNTLWNELELVGDLSSTQKPEIRFMNIGRTDIEKHGAKASLALLKDRFRDSQFPDGGVLIVDEYVESGGSIRRALKTIEDEFEIKPDAVAQFKGLPKWYGDATLGLTGITDNELIHENDRFFDEKFERLRQLESEDALALKEVVNKHAGDFQNFYRTTFYLKYIDGEKREQLTPAKFYDMGIDNVTDKDIDIIDKIIEKCGSLNMGDGDTIEEFIQSAGGFLARPLKEDWQRDNNARYRHLLKSIIRAYVLRTNMERNSVNEIPESVTEIV
ncbi:hypothetical protein GYA27_04205 [candidate division WWE3 bacterium]|uniref:Uncharacterized protein n=1 Tax=candidate division WWE3 bacterium TaxID=2053526 RepID=A0A7X9HH89_UNCKA|nr:hypothetical protein [candidate division WWE3 bacterium]